MCLNVVLSSHLDGLCVLQVWPTCMTLAERYHCGLLLLQIFAMDAIDGQLQQLQELFQNIVTTLRREKEELHVACHQFELVYTIKLLLPMAHNFSHATNQEKQQVADSDARQKDIVKLDVGGTCFHVCRSVLTAQSDNLLNSLFSGRFRIDTQADGTVFIDRYVVSPQVHMDMF